MRTYSAMNTVTGSNGGYLLPSEFMKELFTGIAQYDPLMAKENVRLIETDNGRTLSVPGIDLSTISAAIVAQNVDGAPVANPTVSSNSFAGYTYRTNPIAVTLELEQDSFELASEILKQAFAVGLARGIGADLVNGAGSGSAPQGLLTAAADSTVVTAVSGLVDETSLIQLYFSLNRAYRVSPKCAWVMSDAIYEQIRFLKDTNGRPLLNMRDDTEVLMGKRVLVAPSMPSTAGSKAIVFGDLSQFVVKVSRGVEIKRSFEAINYAEKGIALYTAYLRVDSGLIAPGGSVQPAVYATLHS
jgi:HK97 family phage major capsid protein